MHWRWLAPLPLAAFLCGEAVRAPVLKPELPKKNAACSSYEEARGAYLLAYGWARENRARAREYADSSLRLLEECPSPATETLRARAKELKAKLGASL